MDEYSELLIVNRPVIYISVSELLNTHKVRQRRLQLYRHLFAACAPVPGLHKPVNLSHVSLQLLLEHQEVLCPDPSDPLGLILKDLGPVPGLQELIGTANRCSAVAIRPEPVRV